MQVTESREFFQIEVIIKATTINQDNINIDFKGLNLYSEDEDKLVEIRNRRTIFEFDRCSEGLKLDIFILNEDSDSTQRIDYLIDEDYEIEDILIEISHKKSGKKFDVRVNEQIGEQIKKEVPVELSQELQDSADYILDNLTEGNQSLKSLLFETLRDSESLQTYINQMMEIHL